MPHSRTGHLLSCSYLPCPKRGQSHQVIRFGFYRLKRGRRRRYRCGTCDQTSSRTTDTLYHRLLSTLPGYDIGRMAFSVERPVFRLGDRAHATP